MEITYTPSILGSYVCHACAAIVADEKAHSIYHNSVINAFKERDKAFEALFNVLVDANILRGPKIGKK